MLNAESRQSLLINVPAVKPFDVAWKGANFKRDTNNFHFMEHDEPHYTRRKMILEKHPEIKTLMTQDPISLYLTIALVALQIVIMSYVKDWPVWAIILLAYSLGGLIGNGLFVLIHDLTHFTAFKSRQANQLVAILANFGHGIPTALAFLKFHSMHHMFLGRPNLDPDMPHQWEIKFFRTPFRKVLHLIFMLAFYVVRPYAMPQNTPSFLEILNWVLVISWDFFLLGVFGWGGIIYLIVSTISALGPNPVAARYFAEHFEFVKGQDTYSYYGWFNILIFNVGYHIEHHDFPNIPWRKLPEVKAMAPEFYDTLPHHDSYFRLMWQYLTDSQFGAWCRIGRDQGDDIKRKSL